MKSDKGRLILIYMMLVVIGLASIYSSTFQLLIVADMNPYKDLFIQVVLVVAMLIISIIIINYRTLCVSFLKKQIYPIFFVTTITLFLVLTPLGHVAGGAQSTLKIFLFTVQPIELYKIVIILYMAKVFTNNPKMSNKKVLIYGILIPFIPIILILVEPDLGGFLLLSILLFFMLIIEGEYKRLVTILGGIALIGGMFLVLIFIAVSANGYQIVRITSWLNPFENLNTSGGNLVQSFVSISNGGLGGVGYTNSLQKSGFLFGPSTDFVFSIIAEEWGIIGVIIVIGLLLSLIVQIYIIGMKSNKKFEYLYCSGYALLLLIQSFINIGGVSGIIPMTGVTLPFISKGTNSFIFLTLGLLYVVIISIETEEQKRKLKKRKYVE